MVLQLDSLYQTGVRVSTHSHHTSLLKLIEILAVELKTVTVTLNDRLLAISLSNLRAALQRTSKATQTHCTILSHHLLLLLHNVNYRALGLRIHLA